MEQAIIAACRKEQLIQLYRETSHKYYRFLDIAERARNKAIKNMAVKCAARESKRLDSIWNELSAL